VTPSQQFSDLYVTNTVFWTQFYIQTGVLDKYQDQLIQDEPQTGDKGPDFLAKNHYEESKGHLMKKKKKSVDHGNCKLYCKY